MFPDLSHPVDWLDVGAGYGEFIEAAQAALPSGSKVSGIEPMTSKAAAAQARGLNVSSARLEDLDGTYDAISLINVFSHIPDFTSFGAHLKRLIRPHGLLFIETGNAADLPSRREYPDILYLPDHLVFGGDAQITKILANLGFTVEAIEKAALDTPTFVAKKFIKGILRGRLNLSLPYASPFRTTFYRARLD